MIRCIRIVLATYCLSTSISLRADSGVVHELDHLIISGPQSHSNVSSLQPVSMIQGDVLRNQVANSIGETLKNEPGVTSQSFGPGVGQPVIRGQSGARVKVLQNSVGNLDAASLSPDHANSTEALWAEQIEIIRGPATLLYGSGAIGGIINVIDHRIPTQLFESPVSGAIEQRYNTVNEGKSTAFKLDGSQGLLAWHLDGFYRDNIDMQIPGYAIDESAEAESHDSEHEDEIYNSQGRLKNTHSRARSGTAGISFVGDSGFIGVSVNHLINNYGIPPSAHHHAEETDDVDDHNESEFDQVRIDMEQTRYDLKGELNEPFTGAEKLKLHLSYNDYTHTELENGQAGTVFNHEGFSSRIEVVQMPWLIFDHGITGAQTQNTQFSALGDEAFVPESQLDRFSLFTLQDIHAGDLSYQFGFRLEPQWIKAEGHAEVSHTPVNFSASALWDVTEQDSIRLSFSHSQRAPEIQELFANGPHLATQSYQLGDANLTEETSDAIELGLHLDHSWVQVDINLYHNWVQDYIALWNSGLFFDDHDGVFVDSCLDACLPVYQTGQRDAEFQGFEAQVNLPLWASRYGQLNSQWFADYVRGRFVDGDDVPRMPPLRYGLELQWQHPDWQTGLRITRADRQDNPGENETVTPGYWSLDLKSHYRLDLSQDSSLLLFANASNLLDDDIRRSVSYLRNQAPEAGRAFEMGVRIEF